MTSITIPDLLTIILVDDWYQQSGVKYLAGKAGQKPTFTDSEVIALVLAQDYVPYPSETQYSGFIRANYLDLLLKLIDQGPFNSSCDIFADKGFIGLSNIFDQTNNLRLDAKMQQSTGSELKKT